MEYIGEDNLEVMKLAENYNDFLVSEVASKIEEKDQLVVDFGSGDGFFSRNVSKQIKREIVCIEPAENLRKYYKNHKVLDSLNELTDGSVDFIFSLNVLEHIEDDKTIIENIYEKLKSGGRVYLYVPALMVLYSSMDEKVGHYRRYSKADMSRLFDEKCWKIDECRYVDSLGFFVTLLFKWLGNKDGKLKPLPLKIYDKLIFPLSFLLDKITGGYVLGKNIKVLVTKKLDVRLK